MLQITKGIQKTAVRAVIYGTEGIGKSTLAAALPDALILDTEDGTKQLDVARALVLDWRAAESAIRELISDAQGFRTIVIDSADWLEKSIVDHMCRMNGKKSIEDFGFGKGYTMIAERITGFLAECDKLIAKGINVVFVAHSAVRKVSPPDQTDGYDRYELKLTKQSAPILKEWSDLLLFCNYKIQLVEGTDGRTKAQGSKERVMYASRTAAWDAKNRFGLADELPMQVDQIAHLFADVKARPVSAPPPPAGTQPKQEPKAEPKPEPAKTAEPPAIVLATAEQVKALQALVKSNPKAAARVEAELEAEGAVGVDELSAAIAAEILEQYNEPAKAAEKSPLEELIAGREDAANKVLRGIGWISGSQTWRDVKPDDVHTILNAKAKFNRLMAEAS